LKSKALSLQDPEAGASRKTLWLGIPRPNWSLGMIGLCCFTFTIISYYWPLATVGISVAALGLVTQTSRLRFPAFIWLYLLLMLWATVGLVTSIDAAASYDLIIERLKLIVIMLVIVNTVNTERRFAFFVFFFLGCFMLFPARGALVNYLLGEDLMGRVIWNYIYKNPNDLAVLSLLALGAALAVATAPSVRNIARVGAAVAAAILLVVIIMTKSRGVFLGLMVSMGPAALRQVFTKASRLVYVMVALAALLPFVPDATWDRYTGMGKLTSTDTLAEADPEGSAAERWEIQKNAWHIFLDHPVTGVGVGNFPRANQPYMQWGFLRDTHNTYLNLATELGLPGLLLWLALVFTVLKQTRDARVKLGTAAVGIEYVWMERATLGFLISAFVGTYWGLTFPYLMLALLWCTTNPAMRTITSTTPASTRRI
jgi:O-antigen ligase